MRSLALGRWLLVVLGAITCSACLILDPVDFPTPENQPPVITHFRPSNTGFEVFDLGQPKTFTIFVEDFDEGDTLSARVFEDSRSSFSVQVEDAETNETGERELTATFARGHFSVGCHLIEIDVIDDPSGWTDQDGDGLKAGVGEDTVAWLLLAHDGTGFDNVDLLLGSTNPATCPTNQ